MPKPGLAQSGQWDGRGRWRPAMRRGDFHSGLTLRNRHFLPARLPCGAGVYNAPGANPPHPGHVLREGTWRRSRRPIRNTETLSTSSPPLEQPGEEYSPR